MERQGDCRLKSKASVSTHLTRQGRAGLLTCLPGKQAGAYFQGLLKMTGELGLATLENDSSATMLYTNFEKSFPGIKSGFSF
jgi:hypothetical protein